MPKKKAKGKTNKAANKAKETEATAQTQTQRQIIGNKTQDDDDALLEEAMKLAAAEKKELDAVAAHEKCVHGGWDAHQDQSDCVGFMQKFLDECEAGQNRDDHPIAIVSNAYTAAYANYPNVIDDSAKLRWVLSSFLARGTQKFLEGKYQHAHTSAAIAIYFEQHIAIRLHKTQASPNYAKMIEALHCDPHTLVSHLRNRIPCKCLDKIYKEVKSITKLGRCSNPECTIPGRMVERKGMLHCSRCRREYYCSRECQVAHWPAHKEACNTYVDRQAELEAKQKAAK